MPASTLIASAVLGFSSLPKQPICSLVMPLEPPASGPAVLEGMVRAYASAAALPNCAITTPDGACIEQTSCDGANLDVKFDSRSYMLTSYDGECAKEEFPRIIDGASVETPSYECVDFEEGALFLAGKELSLTVDLSGAGCGCNAAFYLVSMPQNALPGDGGDYYCDANAVSGVYCTEIDLIEANKVGFWSAVHAHDDGNGEGFGHAHYATNAYQRLTAHDGNPCAYGPSADCAINTNKPYDATFTFSQPGAPFHYNITLSQDGRLASVPNVKYYNNPTKGNLTRDEANEQLKEALAGGMTLVVSYWSGNDQADSMYWLDGGCSDSEVTGWNCSNVFNENDWDWNCQESDTSPAECAATGNSYYIRDLSVVPAEREGPTRRQLLVTSQLSSQQPPHHRMVVPQGITTTRRSSSSVRF